MTFSKNCGQQVKSVVLYGLCTQTPAVYDEILKAFPSANIALADPGDCAKGAALLLAGQRGVLQGPPVRDDGAAWCADVEVN